MGSESFPFLFSFAGDGAFTGHTGLTQSADGAAVVTVPVMAEGGDEFLVVGLAFYLVMAPFFGDGAGGMRQSDENFFVPEAVFCSKKIDKRICLCYNLLEYAKGETTYVSDDQ